MQKERQRYQRDSQGKRRAIRRTFGDKVPTFQWFALDTAEMGTLTYDECMELERIFFGGRATGIQDMNLGLSFTFNDRNGGRVVLLWVKNAEHLRFYITLRGVRRPLVAASHNDSEQTADVRFVRA